MSLEYPVVMGSKKSLKTKMEPCQKDTGASLKGGPPMARFGTTRASNCNEDSDRLYPVK